MSDKNKKAEIEGSSDPMKYSYKCSGCSDEALKTSNEMVGVEIDCQLCGKRQTTLKENFVKLS